MYTRVSCRKRIAQRRGIFLLVGSLMRRRKPSCGRRNGRCPNNPRKRQRHAERSSIGRIDELGLNMLNGSITITHFRWRFPASKEFSLWKFAFAWFSLQLLLGQAQSASDRKSFKGALRLGSEDTSVYKTVSMYKIFALLSRFPNKMSVCRDRA